MKKTLFLSAIVFMCSICAKSQILQGYWMAGGNASFFSSKNKPVGDRSTNFEISPAVGYFLIDQLAAGINTNLTALTSTPVSDLKTRVTYYSVGPYVRYYLLKNMEHLNFFINGSTLFGWSRQNRQKGDTFTQYFITVGPTFFFTDNVGIEMPIGYRSTKYKGDTGTSITSVFVGIGLQIYLTNRE
jgi:hypothetical protein